VARCRHDPRPRIPHSSCTSFLDALPARPVLRVLHLDAPRLECLAKLVRSLVIAGPAGREALVEETPVVTVELLRRGRRGFQPEAEDAIHVEDEAEATQPARVVGRVHELQSGFRLRERARRVEVVRDRLGERPADRVERASNDEEGDERGAEKTDQAGQGIFTNIDAAVVA